MNILIFGGTTEGRLLAERLRELPVRLTVSVATEYGGDVLAPSGGDFTIRAGRLDELGMRNLMDEGAFDLVVDATHPYAVAASATIRAAATGADVPYLRLSRPAGGNEEAGVQRVADAQGACRQLAGTAGNVLLATGARDLDAYTRLVNYGERLFPRILPALESLQRCFDLGYRSGNVIAMQGPFSTELNLALLRQYAIQVMVTKDGGPAGGFREKMEAAGQAGVEVIVIGRPSGDAGMPMDDAWREILSRLENQA